MLSIGDLRSIRLTSRDFNNAAIQDEKKLVTAFLQENPFRFASDLFPIRIPLDLTSSGPPTTLDMYRPPTYQYISNIVDRCYNARSIANAIADVHFPGVKGSAAHSNYTENLQYYLLLLEHFLTELSLLLDEEMKDEARFKKRLRFSHLHTFSSGMRYSIFHTILKPEAAYKLKAVHELLARTWEAVLRDNRFTPWNDIQKQDTAQLLLGLQIDEHLDVKTFCGFDALAVLFEKGYEAFETYVLPQFRQVREKAGPMVFVTNDTSFLDDEYVSRKKPFMIDLRLFEIMTGPLGGWEFNMPVDASNDGDTEKKPRFLRDFESCQHIPDLRDPDAECNYAGQDYHDMIY